MFRNREEAALRLARRLQSRPLHDPIVLAIPRGGVALGAVLTRELDAELDVVLARKIRAPFNPELALGAVGEGGSLYLDPQTRELLDGFEGYLEVEVRHQKEEIARRRKLLRGDRPPPTVTGRSVILTDDGIATGSTMIAALKVVADQQPHEVLVAVPVGPPERLAQLKPLCDRLVCLAAPEGFRAISRYYADFHQVEDEEVAGLLADRPTAARA
jgi:predicted phosphoribosyltransferase